MGGCSAGQGAVCAMQYAVILANCLYDMKSLEHDDIEAALSDYRVQRQVEKM
jgi:2-polyprenyl-6-methoxyphenol hydroxylase-like FAD-dependent oxidoreductase